MQGIKNRNYSRKATCSICGKEFIAKAANGHLCSYECREEHKHRVYRGRHNIPLDFPANWERITRPLKNIEWIKDGSPEARYARRIRLGGNK